MPTATRRNRKRKASESDNVTANDEAATIDREKAVGVKQVGEKARSDVYLVQMLTREIATIVVKPKKPPRKRKAPTSERIADTKGTIGYDDMRIENNHQGESSNYVWI